MSKLSEKDIEELRETCAYNCEYSGTRDAVSVIVSETLKEIAGYGLFEDDITLVDWDGEEICELEDFIEAFWDKVVEKILNVVETQ